LQQNNIWQWCAWAHHCHCCPLCIVRWVATRKQNDEDTRMLSHYHPLHYNKKKWRWHGNAPTSSSSSSRSYIIAKINDNDARIFPHHHPLCVVVLLKKNDDNMKMFSCRCPLLRVTTNQKNNMPPINVVHWTIARKKD
jgi:hypothetical protein